MAAPKMKNSGYDRNPHDWYVEPTWCVDLLLDQEDFGGVVYDPACGQGTIVKACRARGIESYGSDLVDRGFGRSGMDFLDGGCPWIVPDHIVTNPPYKLAIPFIQRARQIARSRVAALVRLDFLASQKRRDFINEAARVYILSKRPSMPPGAFDGKASGGQHDFCWIVYDAHHTGPSLLRCIAPKVSR